MNLMKSLKTAVVAVFLFSASVANAALIQFNLTGDYTASWQLESTTPDDVFDGVWATYIDVTGSFPGASQAAVDVTFYTPVLQGGFEIYDYNADIALVATAGPMLYTESANGPLFTFGTFALTAYDGPGNYTLSISAAAPVDVPEPATSALLLGGLGLMFASGRRFKALRRS